MWHIFYLPYCGTINAVIAFDMNLKNVAIWGFGTDEQIEIRVKKRSKKKITVNTCTFV